MAQFSYQYVRPNELSLPFMAYHKTSAYLDELNMSHVDTLYKNKQYTDALHHSRHLLYRTGYSCPLVQFLALYTRSN